MRTDETSLPTVLLAVAQSAAYKTGDQDSVQRQIRSRRPFLVETIQERPRIETKSLPEDVLDERGPSPGGRRLPTVVRVGARTETEKADGQRSVQRQSRSQGSFVVKTIQERCRTSSRGGSPGTPRRQSRRLQSARARETGADELPGGNAAQSQSQSRKTSMIWDTRESHALGEPVPGRSVFGDTWTESACRKAKTRIRSCWEGNRF